MLVSLHVKNLALIEEEEVFFDDGLNILTGETGAGKSIILGSINLALGARADRDSIRTGAEYALIELIFKLDHEKQESMAQKLEIPVEEDNMLIIQRKIMQGRSVCKINGETVSASSLKAMASVLLDIHGQHEHQSLLKVSRHKEFLDLFAARKLKEPKAKLAECYRQYTRLKHELEQEDLDEAARQREMDFIRYEIEEITKANLQPEEDVTTEQLFKKILNAKKIKEAASLTYGMTGYQDPGSAGEILGRALKELKAVRQYDDQIDDLSEQLQNIDDLLNDFNRSLADYISDLTFDDQLFNETENRLNVINHLKNKYGFSVEEITAHCQEKEERLSVLENYERSREQLKQELQGCVVEVLALCKTISGIRKKQAKLLTEQLCFALHDLNFPDVKFEIAIESAMDEFTADGYDKIEFMISTNPGEALKPLHQIASGGELSRIMLALKTVLAQKDAISTLIFDEIDVGISGKTAWKVSEKLGMLSRNHQIICITHLAQIAAMADSHFEISKTVEKDRTITSIVKMKEEESVCELARLLGSEVITEAVLNNAKEMKELAVKTKKEYN